MSGIGSSPRSKNKRKKKNEKKKDRLLRLCSKTNSYTSKVLTRVSTIKDKRKKCKSDNKPQIPQTVRDFSSNLSFVYDRNMTFHTQATQLGMPQSQQQPYMQSPPPSQMGIGFQVPAPYTAPPPWAAKLLVDMDQTKEKFKGMDKIEKKKNSQIH